METPTGSAQNADKVHCHTSLTNTACSSSPHRPARERTKRGVATRIVMPSQSSGRQVAPCAVSMAQEAKFHSPDLLAEVVSRTCEGESHHCEAVDSTGVSLVPLTTGTDAEPGAMDAFASDTPGIGAAMLSDFFQFQLSARRLKSRSLRFSRFGLCPQRALALPTRRWCNCPARMY